MKLQMDLGLKEKGKADTAKLVTAVDLDWFSLGVTFKFIEMIHCLLLFLFYPCDMIKTYLPVFLCHIFLMYQYCTLFQISSVGLYCNFFGLKYAGFNVETVEYKNISFTVWDVGGQDKVCSFFCTTAL